MHVAFARRARTSFKSLRLLFLIVVATLLCFGTTMVQAAGAGQSDGVPQAQSQLECSNNPIPSGYVVTQVNGTTGNPCSPYEQFTITIPSGNALQICNVEGLMPSVPTGWVITSINTQAGPPCDVYQPEMLTALSGNQMNVCANTTLPTNWVVSGIQEQGSTCGQDQIYTIRLVQGTEMSACANFPIPSGWVATSAGPVNGVCAQDNTLVIQVMTPSIGSICGIGPFPPGYIIARVDGNGGNTCLLFEQFTITPVSGTGMGGCYISAQSLGTDWVVSSLGSAGGNNCLTYPPETITHVSPYSSSSIMCSGASNLPTYWEVQSSQSGLATCTGLNTEVIAPIGGPSIEPKNQTLIAAYNPNTGSGNVPSDLNGDGLSDVLLFNKSSSQLQYLLTGNSGGKYVTSLSRTVPVTSGYWIGALGSTGLVWTSANNDLYLWTPTVSNGAVYFSSTFIADYPAGWTLIGAAASGTGSNSDLLWIDDSTCQFGWWQMNGAQRESLQSYSLPSCGTHIVAVGYYSGEPTADLFVVTGGSYPDLQWWVKDASYGTIQPDGYAHLDLGPLPPGKFAGAATALGITTPTVYFIQSNGTSVAEYAVQRSGASGSLLPGTLNTIPAGNYIGQIGGTYDGSGHQSLLWANDTTGILSIWEQTTTSPTNLGFSNQPSVATYGSGWTVVGGLQ